MTTPNFPKTPDFTPVVRLMAMQTRFAIETSQGMLKLAMLPWQGLPATAMGNLCAPFGATVLRRSVELVETATETAIEAAEDMVADTADVAENVTEAVAETAVETLDAAEEITETDMQATGDTLAETADATPVVETAAEAEPAAVEPAPVAVADEPAAALAVDEPLADEPVADTAEPAQAPVAVAAGVTPVQPPALDAPRDGEADDLKQMKGFGPKLDRTLRGMGYFHFDQIAAWTPAEVAWIDENLPGFKGRASRDNWVAQAKALMAAADA